MVEPIKWELHKFDAVENKITVIDSLSKKEKTYHVPDATHAILKDDVLYVSTSDNKVTRVCIHVDSRQILSLEEYKNLDL
jgi:DNA-binding LytR/AlgR family response regulator